MIPQVVGKTIWDELPNANVDTQKLEHLFESRAKDLMTKVRNSLGMNSLRIGFKWGLAIGCIGAR